MRLYSNFQFVSTKIHNFWEISSRDPIISWSIRRHQYNLDFVQLHWTSAQSRSATHSWLNHHSENIAFCFLKFELKLAILGKSLNPWLSLHQNVNERYPKKKKKKIVAWLSLPELSWSCRLTQLLSAYVLNWHSSRLFHGLFVPTINSFKTTKTGLEKLITNWLL